MFEPDFDDDPILPDPPPGGVPVLHDREYRVRSFRLAADRLLLQGALRDQKPAGLYISGDPDPLTVHHMHVELEIAFPSLEIVAVRTSMETHPERECPGIVERYQELVGMSIARGFSRAVREMFGGPRGCAHIGALLQAMAPVAIQSLWSMRSVDAALDAVGTDADPAALILEPSETSTTAWKMNVDTCHVWADGGDMIAQRLAGEPFEVPVFLVDRMAKLGIDPDR